MALQYKQFRAIVESAPADEIALLNRQFCSFLISLNFARSLDATSTYEVEQETVRQRELLAVEQRREEERMRIRNSRRYQQEAMFVELHERLFEQLSETLNNPDYVRARILDVPNASVALLDAVNSRAASLKTLEQHAEGLNWLIEGLLRVVNLPPFADPKDPKRVKVTSLRNALGFIGTEDLKILVPAFSMQQWIPKHMEPFNLFRRKLWEHSLGTAITCQVLAELDGTLDPVVAFITGLFHDLGKAVLARLYSICFDDVQRDMLRELREEVRSDRYNAVIELEPSELMLRNLMLVFDRSATAKVFEAMGLKFVPLAGIYDEFACTEKLSGLSGYGRLLYKATKYSEFRMMHSANLVTAEEGRLMSKDAGLGRHELEVLRKTNLRRLRLSRGSAAEDPR